MPACLRRNVPVLIVSLSVAVIVALLPSPPAMGQENGSDEIELVASDGITSLVLNEVGDFVSITDGGVIRNGCYQTSDGSVCVGDGDADLLVSGDPGPTVEIEGGFVQRQALEWMIPEALTYLQAAYDLPADDRLERYARADIRAYMVNRILDIIDRAAYNLPLTTDEAQTLEVISKEILDTDSHIAEYAYAEYERFRSNPCFYVPPSAPAYVTEPVHLPEDLVNFCTRANHPLAVAFEFVTPQPSGDQFTTWGVYRHIDELGLGEISGEVVQENLVLTNGALAFGLGVAGTALVASFTALAVGSSSVVAGAVVGAIGGALLKSFTVQGALYALPLVSKLGIGASVAAGVVAIVLLAAIIAGVGIYMLVEQDKVGTALSAAVDDVANAKDPFGLEALKAQNQGKDLREGLTPENVPHYRQDGMVTRLNDMVTRWMTVGISGAVADPTGVWDPSATSFATDWTWEVTDSADDTEQVETLLFPMPDGNRGTVRFDRGWMVHTNLNSPDGPQAALKFAYEKPDGVAQIVSRTADGKLLVTDVSADDEENAPLVVGEHAVVDSIQFLHPDSGELVTARLVDPDAPSDLLGPRPTVAGALVPGRVHNLRPNPIDENGSFDLNRFQTDYSYLWELERFDEEADDWVAVQLQDADGYGAQFIPTASGQYRGWVTMTSLADPSEEKVGAVEFVVGPPVITVTEGTLVDDGFNELRVDLALSQNTPGGNFTVDVQWPGELGSDAPRPAAQVEIECLPDTSTTCATPATAGVPVLAEALTYQLEPFSNLSQPVEVTITNDYGGVTTLTLPIDSPDRPVLTDPGPVAPGQDGTVLFGSYVTDAQIPVATTGGANYTIARIEPGTGEAAGFSLLDPATGNPGIGFEVVPGNPRMTVSVFTDDTGDWVVGLHAVPNWEDVGVYLVPVSLVQSNGRTTTVLLHLDVVAAPDSKYRAVLGSDVDPLDFEMSQLPEMLPLVVSGLAEWQPFADELCASLQNTNSGSPPVVKCAPIGDFVGPDDELTFPWVELAPYGIEVGIHRARVWLEDTEQSYPEPYQVSFFMTSAPPVIAEFTWDDDTGLFSLAVTPGDADIASVKCTLDGDPVESCFDLVGGAWGPGDLADGGHTFSVEVTDEVGNYTTDTLDFVVGDPDQTPPVIDADVSGPPGNNGWYVGDVTVTWTVTDNESDVTASTGCDPTTIDADTAGDMLECEATSEGGTASDSVTVMRDATPPVVSVSGVVDGAVYEFGGAPVPGCDSVDATSGLAAEATIEVTGGETDGSGEFTATCDGAVDNAGNQSAPVIVDYTISPADTTTTTTTIPSTTTTTSPPTTTPTAPSSPTSPETTDWFVDDNGHLFEGAINWIADAGYTKGCNPPVNDMFCPNRMLSRGEMATFFARVLGLPASDTDWFEDDDGSVHEGGINRIAEVGITVGCNPPDNDLFCPDRTLTRAEMATLMARALHLPATNTDWFGDDDASVHEGGINRIAEAGITFGCNPPDNDRFCPDRLLTRGEMAAFLRRAFATTDKELSRLEGPGSLAFYGRGASDRLLHEVSLRDP